MERHHTVPDTRWLANGGGRGPGTLPQSVSGSQGLCSFLGWTFGKRQDVHEVQRRSELQKGPEGGIGPGALTPAPEG